MDNIVDTGEGRGLNDATIDAAEQRYRRRLAAKGI
jgi:hypothetical protein